MQLETIPRTRLLLPPIIPRPPKRPLLQPVPHLGGQGLGAFKTHTGPGLQRPTSQSGAPHSQRHSLHAIWGHTLQKQTHQRAYNDFEALRYKLNTEPGQERLQYTVETEEAYWIPPNDQPLITRSSPSTQLKALLTVTPPSTGLGQYTQHSCCTRCINAEISPMIILRDNQDNDQAEE